MITYIKYVLLLLAFLVLMVVLAIFLYLCHRRKYVSTVYIIKQPKRDLKDQVEELQASSLPYRPKPELKSSSSEYDSESESSE